MRSLVALLVICSVFGSCSISKRTTSVSIHSLKYIGGYEVPYNTQFKGTTVGGLSGIDYDAKDNVYYLICDDRSQTNPARFYTAKINITQQGINNVEFINVTSLLQPDGQVYPSSKKDPAHAPDPEAMRYDPKTGLFVWASEGERLVKDGIIGQPAITIINKEGQYTDTFPLPVQTHFYLTERGMRKNSSFEGLAFADNFKTMYVSVEEPLYEDGPSAGLIKTDSYTRILQYDVATKKILAQYAYNLEPVAHASKPVNEFMINGIPDILSIGKNKLLVIERSFSTGIQASTIRVFITDLANASDISGITSLREQSFKYPAFKKLLLNMDDLGIHIDNIEGVTFGPDLPNGHKTLIFVSDNNFSKDQKTQFFLFEVN